MAKKALVYVAISLMLGVAVGLGIAMVLPDGSDRGDDGVILDNTDTVDVENLPAEHQHQTTLDLDGRITGRVVMLEKFVEGETDRFHFLVIPDPQFGHMLNDANREKLGGAMMVELDYQDMGILPRLHIGQHLEIRGPYVVDNDNEYNEIDPAVFIKDLSI